LAAISLCSAAYFPTRFKFLVPLGALLISDVILNFYYDAPLLAPLIACRYLTLIVIGFLGLALQNRASLKTLLPASILASTIFYVVTCTFAWLSDPGYVRNFAGLIQSLTVGLTNYSATPSWMFFRNSLISDLIFTFAFVLCITLSRNPESARSKSPLPRPA
jgi:hypothetical protein